MESNRKFFYTNKENFGPSTLQVKKSNILLRNGTPNCARKEITVSKPCI